MRHYRERRHHSVAYFTYLRFGRRARFKVGYLGYLPQLVCGIDDIGGKEGFYCIAHMLKRTFSRAELVRLYSRLKNIRLELLSGLRAHIVFERAIHTLEQLADVDIILVSEYRLGCLGAERFLGLCALLITYIGIITVKSADVVGGGFYLRGFKHRIESLLSRFGIGNFFDYNAVIVSIIYLLDNRLLVCFVVKFGHISLDSIRLTHIKIYSHYLAVC